MKSGNQKLYEEITGHQFGSQLGGIISENTLQLVLRAIDCEASGTRMWFDECTKEGQAESELQKRYQSSHNTLVNLRKKLNPEYLRQFVNKIYPKAEPIYTCEKTPAVQPTASSLLPR